MATSGVTGQLNITADQAIDMALRQCRFNPSEKTSDINLYAVTSLELILKALPNDGYDRWLQATTIIGLLPNVTRYKLPSGAADAINVSRRNCQWPYTTGSASSSSGGLADNAFDNSLDTACIQTIPNGNISYNFGVGYDQTVFYAGISSFGTYTYTLSFEYSLDGITCVSLYNAPAASYVDKEWTFYTITRPVTAQYFRVRETGGATLSVRSVFFGYGMEDTLMGRINRDNRAALPDKAELSTQPVQYYVSVESSGVYLELWPVPSDPFAQLYVMYYTQPQDIGAVINTLDIPARWQKGVITNLAYELGKYLPNVTEETMMRLERDYTQQIEKASVTDNDKSRVNFTMSMGRYFR